MLKNRRKLHVVFKRPSLDIADIYFYCQEEVFLGYDMIAGET